MAVLILEIWLDYRRQIVVPSQYEHRLEARDLSGDDAGVDEHQRTASTLARGQARVQFPTPSLLDSGRIWSSG
jgi:hypothetical protein